MHQPDATGQRVARPGERDRRSVQAQLSAIRTQAPGEDLEQRRLARAVLADDRVRLAVRHRKRHIAQRGDGAERFVDVAEFDGGHVSL